LLLTIPLAPEFLLFVAYSPFIVLLPKAGLLKYVLKSREILINLVL